MPSTAQVSARNTASTKQKPPSSAQVAATATNHQKKDPRGAKQTFGQYPSSNGWTYPSPHQLDQGESSQMEWANNLHGAEYLAAFERWALRRAMPSYNNESNMALWALTMHRLHSRSRSPARHWKE